MGLMERVKMFVERGRGGDCGVSMGEDFRFEMWTGCCHGFGTVRCVRGLSLEACAVGYMMGGS
jgi:hypothetical protein